MSDDQISARKDPSESAASAVLKNEGIVCPVFGEVAVQEKCKLICRSEVCRGRVIYNCSEF